MKRAIGAITLAALVSVGLTACDPPMPPDVAAQIAEQTFTCVPGNSTISYPELMSDISQGLSDSLAAACVPPLDEMTSSIVGPGEPADIMISDYPVDCPALLTVPYATEAADLITNFADGFSINLSPATAAKILNGQITNWGDAAIAKENPDVELPKEPIVVRQSVDKNALLAMKKWFAHFGAEITHKFETTTTQLYFDQMAEGEIAILPHSLGVNAGLTPTSIIVGRADGADVLALADTNGIGSAATQWVATQKGKNVAVKLDFNQAPQVQSGFDTAETPYQAIYPVNLTICGKNSLLNRANANFLLRLDSQGSLGASSYNPLSESVRAISLMAVRIGLPQPTEAPASN